MSISLFDHRLCTYSLTSYVIITFMFGRHHGRIVMHVLYSRMITEVKRQCI